VNRFTKLLTPNIPGVRSDDFTKHIQATHLSFIFMRSAGMRNSS
jgi:hypothetical protein